MPQPLLTMNQRVELMLAARLRHADEDLQEWQRWQKEDSTKLERLVAQYSTPAMTYAELSNAIGRNWK